MFIPYIPNLHSTLLNKPRQVSAHFQNIPITPELHLKPPLVPLLLSQSHQDVVELSPPDNVHLEVPYVTTTVDSYLFHLRRFNGRYAVQFHIR